MKNILLTIFIVYLSQFILANDTIPLPESYEDFRVEFVNLKLPTNHVPQQNIETIALISGGFLIGLPILMYAVEPNSNNKTALVVFTTTGVLLITTILLMEAK